MQLDRAGGILAIVVNPSIVATMCASAIDLDSGGKCNLIY